MTHRGPHTPYRRLVLVAEGGVADNAMVCDICGRAASQTVTIEVGDDDFEKDLCGPHLAELLQGAWSPPRGRRFVLMSGALQAGHGRPPDTLV